MRFIVLLLPALALGWNTPSSSWEVLRWVFGHLPASWDAQFEAAVNQDTATRAKVQTAVAKYAAEAKAAEDAKAVADTKAAADAQHAAVAKAVADTKAAADAQHAAVAKAAADAKAAKESLEELGGSLGKLGTSASDGLTEASSGLRNFATANKPISAVISTTEKFSYWASAKARAEKTARETQTRLDRAAADKLASDAQALKVREAARLRLPELLDKFGTGAGDLTKVVDETTANTEKLAQSVGDLFDTLSTGMENAGGAVWDVSIKKHPKITALIAFLLVYPLACPFVQLPLCPRLKKAKKSRKGKKGKNIRKGRQEEDDDDSSD